MSIENRLNNLFQEAVALSQNNEIWNLYEKAESISGFDSLLQSRGSMNTVLKQDSLTVLSWLNNKLTTMDHIDIAKVKGLFFIVGLVSNHFNFWALAKVSSVNFDSKLIKFSKLIVSNVSSKVDFDSVTHYHEEERQNYISKIAVDNDWSKLYEEYHRSHDSFEHSICYSIKSAFCLLYYFDKKSLMSILDINRDIPMIWGMMDLVGKHEAMDIALETTNQTLKFSAIASVLPFSGKDSLNVYEREKLTIVFLDFMNDDNLWSHWMKTLNTYPLRYPHIQFSLGKALAQTTSTIAIQTYFNAINLRAVNTEDDCRSSVSECLEVFSEFSSKETQRLAWSYAFSIWSNWCFGTKEKGEHLFKVEASALDYAVTRYYLECVDSEGRKVVIEELREKLNNVDNVWHQTSTKHTTYWYLQNSKLQPLYHADRVNSDSNLPYLMEGVYYQHNYSGHEEYIKFMIR